MGDCCVARIGEGKLLVMCKSINLVFELFGLFSFLGRYRIGLIQFIWAFFLFLDLAFMHHQKLKPPNVLIVHLVESFCSEGFIYGP